MSKKKLLTVLAGLASLCIGVNAAELNAYSVMPEKYASRIFAEFTKDTGIKVNFLRFSTGEALARLTAEKGNPQVDIMMGGPADMYAAASKEGIFEAYRPAGSDAIDASMRDPNNYWTGIGVIPLCFLTNTKFLKKNNMEPPKKWSDLLDPRYKKNLQMADARTSGTATERIFSLVKIMGEDEAFKFQKQLNGTIQMYTKSGAGGAMPIATGQCASGIFYIVDALDIQQQGYPVVISYPEDGVSYGIEATGVIKGGKNNASTDDSSNTEDVGDGDSATDEPTEPTDPGTDDATPPPEGETGEPGTDPGEETDASDPEQDNSEGGNPSSGDPVEPLA